MNEIKKIVNQFKKVSLADLDRVELMNRMDLKFCFHIDLMPAVFQALKNHYSALEIDGESVFSYYNIYYDTPDNQMYLWHHNGKLNRYKIRVRRYNQTGASYLEIKYKNNKGRTIKDRIKRPLFDASFSNTESSFIQKFSPFASEELYPKMVNTFDRITLVNREFTERVTIDFAPGFKNPSGEITLDKLIIVEVKQDKSSENAHFVKILKSFKVEGQGFSKYCIGRSLLDEVKKNNFKPQLLKIKKHYLN